MADDIDKKIEAMKASSDSVVIPVTSFLDYPTGNSFWTMLGDCEYYAHSQEKLLGSEHSWFVVGGVNEDGELVLYGKGQLKKGSVEGWMNDWSHYIEELEDGDYPSLLTYKDDDALWAFYGAVEGIKKKSFKGITSIHLISLLQKLDDDDPYETNPPETN